VDGRLKAEHGADPGKVEAGKAGDVGLAKEAVQIEEAIDAEKLTPAGILSWAEGVVLVVGDGECAGFLDLLNRRWREVDGLVEEDDVRFCVAHAAQQVAIDSGDEWPGGKAIGERSQHASPRRIRSNVKDGEILAEAAQALLAVGGCLAGVGITNVKDSAFAH
jgi:hypothetical protein